MTYRLYATEWNLTPTTTTAIYAVFPIVVVAFLICFGDLSDYIGRRTTILIGLGASLLGTFLFAIGPNVIWIFVGRFLMGAGVGLSMGPATAAMAEFNIGPPKRASSIATAAQAIGFALATLIGGALVQYAPFPTRLNFWVLCVIISLTFAASWFLPRHLSNENPRPWRPKPIFIPKLMRKVFAAATAAVTAGYLSGGLMLALGGQIAHDLINSNNMLVSGAALSLLPIMMGSVGILAKGFATRFSIIAGGAISTLSMLLLMLAVDLHSLPFFLTAIASAGIGCSFLFLGGLNMIMVSAPVDYRGSTLSALYLAAYLMQGLVAFLAGIIATRRELTDAVALASVSIALLSIAAVALSLALGNLEDNGSLQSHK